MKPIQEREADFRTACNAFNAEFGPETVDQFFMYWTEPNKSGTKLRWEMEKTWEIRRRLITWQRNNEKWNKNGTHQQFNPGSTKLGTSAARIEAARKF